MKKKRDSEDNKRDSDERPRRDIKRVSFDQEEEEEPKKKEEPKKERRTKKRKKSLKRKKNQKPILYLMISLAHLQIRLILLHQQQL